MKRRPRVTCGGVGESSLTTPACAVRIRRRGGRRRCPRDDVGQSPADRFRRAPHMAGPWRAIVRRRSIRPPRHRPVAHVCRPRPGAAARV